MPYEFDMSILGGLPVTIAYTTTNYDNRDCGGGINDVDEWWITAVNGRKIANSNWLLKRIDSTNQRDEITQACYKHKSEYNEYDK